MSGNPKKYPKASKGNPPGVLKPQKVFMDLHSLMDAAAHKLSYERVVEMAELAKEVAEEEQNLYFKFVAKLMGTQEKPTKDPETGDRIDAFSRVKWLPLRPRTRARKEKLKGNSFRNIKWVSGESTMYGRIPLKSYLKQLDAASHIKEKTIYRIHKTTTDRARVQKYRVLIRPGLNDGIWAFNDSDNDMLESKEQERKVNAPNKYRRLSNEQARPIFRPVMEYFAVQRIPRRINKELKKRGYRGPAFA